MSFLVYKSSAGSGKTFTLVKEYLKIVLGNPESFRNILALTFTNKAANEMKTRVISYLEGLADPNTGNRSSQLNNLAGLISSETGLKENEITQNAARVLELILHNYSDFAIGTIDSFVHRVIRTFARDLHIPLNFEVELDQETMIAEAVDVLISRIGQDNELTNALVGFALMKSEGDKSWNIEDDLNKFSKEIFKENGQAALGKLRNLNLSDFKRIKGSVEDAIKLFETDASRFGKEGQNFIDKNGISKASFYQGERGIPKYFKNLADSVFDNIYPEPSKYFVDTFENDKWTALKTDKADVQKIEEIKDQLRDIFTRSQDYFRVNFQFYQVCKLLKGTLYPLSVLHEIDSVLNEIKDENNILHISEFNRMIAKVVLGEPAPFIYERLGEKYHYFLLDEFQDTSLLQWQNLLPLVENALAEGYQCTLVGDGKQAIYRWRNGEVEQFARLPYIYNKPDVPGMNEREQALIRNYLEKPLERNFRTRKKIVEFNNSFFRFVAAELDKESRVIYDKLEQIAEDDSDEGLVSVFFADKKDKDTNLEEANFNKISEIIAEALEDGYQYSDIAILCRQNEKAGLIAAWLISEGINIHSAESVLLANSPLVNFLVSCLKFVDDANDAVAEATIRYYLNITKRHIDHRIILAKPSLKSLPVFDLVEELIRQFDLGYTTDPFLTFFLDTIIQFNSKRLTSISLFLQWWESQKNKLSIVTPENIDAVRIMTIHKAKGLEFPVVIFAFADISSGNKEDYIWVDLEENRLPELHTALFQVGKDMQQTSYAEIYKNETEKTLLDFCNLLYVAMTRPRDRLYIITTLPPEKLSEKIGIPILLSRFLTEKGLLQDGDNSCLVGKRSKRSSERKPEPENYELQRFISLDWREKIQLRQNFPEYWDAFAPEKSTEKGSLFHDLLSGLKYTRDLEKIVDLYIQQGIISPDERHQIINKLLKYINFPEASDFFKEGQEVKTEAEIISNTGKVYRPDRIIFSPEKTIVVEYKTGEPKDFHRSQLAAYTSELEKMKYPSIEGYLYYLKDEPELIKI